MQAPKKEKQSSELVKLANFLAERAIVGQEKRMHLAVMVKLAQPPVQENPVSRWMGENLYDPVAKSMTGQVWGPEQKNMANRVLGGLGLGLGGGALLGGLSALRQPKRKRNILGQALTGSLLGAALGGAAGGGYHALQGMMKGETPKVTPPPTGLSRNPLLAVGQSVLGNVPAQVGSGNVVSQGLLANIARRQGEVAPATDVARLLTTPDVHIPIDPEKAREIRAGGPAAMNAAVEALTTQGGPGYFDRRQNKWVPFTKENIDVFRNAIESIPVQGGGIARKLQDITTDHTTLDALAALGITDVAGRGYRHWRPSFAAQEQGLAGPVVGATGKTIIHEPSRQLLGAAAAKSPTTLAKTIAEPAAIAKNPLDMHRDLVRRALAAGKILTPNAALAAAGRERRLAGAWREAKKHTQSLQNMAYRAGRAHQGGFRGTGFAGTGMLRSRLGGALPYAAALPLTYMMFDRPQAPIDTRVQSLYNPAAVEAAQQKGLLPG